MPQKKTAKTLGPQKMRSQAPKTVLAGLHEGEEAESHRVSPDEVGRPPSLGDRILEHTVQLTFSFRSALTSLPFPPSSILLCTR